MQRSNLEELINKEDPRWPSIQSSIKEAANQVEVLPAGDPDRSEALVATQVTTRSPMGAVIYEQVLCCLYIGAAETKICLL